MWDRLSTKQLAAIAIVAAAGFSLGMAGPASSNSSGVVNSNLPVITVPLQGSGWTFFPLPAGVNQSKTLQHVVQGTLSSSGECVFANTATAAPGFGGREEDEIALNPSTCQAVVASGPIQAASALSGSNPSTGPTPDVLPCPSCGGGGGNLEAAYLKSWWEDPAYIVVTSLRDDVEWTYSNGCDTAYLATHAQTYFYESGWISDYQNNFTHLACGAAISNSDALMENDPFCWAAFGDPEVVYTHYDYNHEVVGKPTGAAVWAWNDYASSTLDLCWRLLSWHHVYNFEAPF